MTDREAKADHSSLVKVRRAQAVLERLVANETLTPSGRDFLIAALDPMHDLPLMNLKGWPDIETAASIVRCVKQTTTIKTPYAPGTGNWDCLISLWPWLNNITCNAYSRVGDVIGTPAGPPAFPLGGLQMWTNASGVAMNLTTGSLAQIVLPDAYSQGSGRIVGIGFEVVNTTAEIYKQGQVTVFRQPQPSLDPTTVTICAISGVSTFRPLSAIPLRLPPIDQATTMLLPGSRQWMAADGAYVVGCFAGAENPAKPIDWNHPMGIADLTTLSTGATGSAFLPQTLGNAAPIGGASLAPYFPNEKVFPIHTGGAYFTGLSEQTTLSVTLNIYVETFPSPMEDIVTLATPSAEYDSRALEIFSHALNTLPVGVPADMNGFGDWFAGVISQVAKWVSPTLMALPNPLAKAAGAALGGAGGLADDYIAANSPQSKPRVQVKQPVNKQQKQKQNPAKKKRGNRNKQKQ
jgi:hypothetical protein